MTNQLIQKLVVCITLLGLTSACTGGAFEPGIQQQAKEDAQEQASVSYIVRCERALQRDMPKVPNDFRQLVVAMLARDLFATLKTRCSHEVDTNRGTAISIDLMAAARGRY